MTDLVDYIKSSEGLVNVTYKYVSGPLNTMGVHTPVF